MSGWIIRERIKSAKALVEFDGMGYRYDAERSTPDEPVFVREDGDGLTPTPRSAKLGAMNQPSLERGADDQTFHDVIEAYCGALSYALGETATVHVSTHAAAYDVVVEGGVASEPSPGQPTRCPAPSTNPRPMPTRTGAVGRRRSRSRSTNRGSRAFI